MQGYIVFALPRTGSTTLMRLLNCREGLRCVFEPFNPTHRNPVLAGCNTLRKEQGLGYAVQWLWTVCNGFKHVWRWDGWPFADEPDLNRQLLLLSGARIILLHRRNLLRRAMSVLISEQMQLWNPGTTEDFARIRHHVYEALDVEELRAEIAGAREGLAWAQRELAGSKVSWCELTYEELFETHLPGRARIEIMQQLLEFLEIERANDTEQAMMRRLMNPSVTGFRNRDSYRKIPNIDQVERELGSNETGHVFETSPADIVRG